MGYTSMDSNTMGIKVYPSPALSFEPLDRLNPVSSKQKKLKPVARNHQYDNAMTFNVNLILASGIWRILHRTAIFLLEYNLTSLCRGRNTNIPETLSIALVFWFGLFYSWGWWQQYYCHFALWCLSFKESKTIRCILFTAQFHKHSNKALIIKIQITIYWNECVG